MRPLKLGVAFGLGTMFGVLMSRGARSFHCHRACMAGHHPWRCHHTQEAQRKEVKEEAAKDEATLANN